MRPRHPGPCRRPLAGGLPALAVARAIAAGIDPEPLVQKAGLTLALLEDRDARIGARNQITLLNLVASAVGDELLGFHLAEGFDLREIGLFYYVLASSATLGQALTRTVRYSGVTNEGIKVQCRKASDLCVHVSYVGVPRHSDRHQMEFWATALVRVCRHLTGHASQADPCQVLPSALRDRPTSRMRSSAAKSRSAPSATRLRSHGMPLRFRSSAQITISTNF